MEPIKEIPEMEEAAEEIVQSVESSQRSEQQVSAESRFDEGNSLEEGSAPHEDLYSRLYRLKQNPELFDVMEFDSKVHSHIGIFKPRGDMSRMKTISPTLNTRTLVPKANIMYSQGELTPDLRLKRIASLTSHREEDITEEISKPILQTDQIVDEYDHKEAEHKYLQQKPPCFILFGKPGIGQNEVGRRLAEDRNCVYLDPEVLVLDEIERNTKLGLLLEYSLRLDRTIHPEVVTRLMEHRINSLEVENKGYVLAGVPMIPYDTSSDLESLPMVSESAVFTVEQTMHELLETSIIDSAMRKRAENLLRKQEDEIARALLSKGLQGEEGAGEEETEKGIAEKGLAGEGGEASPRAPKQSVDIIPKAADFDPASLYTRIASESSIKLTSSMLAVPQDPVGDTRVQLASALALNAVNPQAVLVYITCPDDDAITKRIVSLTENIPIDFRTEAVVNEEMSEQDEYEDAYNFDDEYKEYAIPSPEDTSMKPSGYDLQDTRDKRKYIVFPERNDRDSIRQQIQHYKEFALPLIEDSMLVRDPQFVIRVDGRSTKQMLFEAIRTRVDTLPLPYATAPERFFPPGQVETTTKVEPKAIDEGAEEEEEQEGLGEVSDDLFAGKTPMECLQMLTRMDRISPLYRWNISDWGVTCPVSLKEGRAFTGNPKLAVRYLDKIYFMSSEEALKRFKRNPRSYLMPPQPRAAGRIFIMGPRGIGKSLVAQCLTYLFNAKLLELEKVREKYRLDKIIRILYERYPEAFAKAQAEVLLKRIKLWELSEQERLASAKAFKEDVSERIRQFMRVKKFIGDCESPSYCDCKCTCGKRSGCTCWDLSDVKYTVQEMEEFFASLNLPVSNDLYLCLKIRKDLTLLDDYLPDNLRISPEKPTEVPHTDLEVLEIVKSGLPDLKEVDEIQIEQEDLAPMFAEAIETVDKEILKSSNERFKYGPWIIDSVPWNEACFQGLADKNALPDDVIILRESDPDYPFTVNKLEHGRNNRIKFREYKEFFRDLGEKSAMENAPSITTTLSMMYEAIQELIREILRNPIFDLAQIEDTELKTSESSEKLRKEYKEHIQEFETGYSELMDQIEDMGLEPVEIDVTGLSDADILKEVVHKLELKYRQRAQDYTDRDVEAELKDIEQEYKIVVEKLGLGGEDYLDVGLDPEDKEGGSLKFAEHRRFGDTGNYCPVAYKDHGVLWLGKNEFMARYHGKIYLMSTQEAKDAFMNSPDKYAPMKTPPSEPLPVRIFITGPVGSGKKTISKEIAHDFGFYDVNLLKELDYIFHPQPPLSRSNIEWFVDTDQKEPEPDDVHKELQTFLSGTMDPELASYYARHLFDPLWHFPPLCKSAGIAVNEVLNAALAEHMLNRYAIPDVIIEAKCKQDVSHIHGFDTFFNKWKDVRESKRLEVRKKNYKLYQRWLKQRDQRFTDQYEELRSRRYAEYHSNREQVLSNQQNVTIEETYENYPDHFGTTEQYQEEDDYSVIPEEQTVTSHDSLPAYPYIDDTYVQSMDDGGSSAYVWSEMENDVKAIFEKLDAANPMPEFQEEDDPNWETEQEAKERIATKIEDWFETEMDGILEAKEILKEAGIPWIEINIDNNTTKMNMVNEVIYKLLPYKDHKYSTFERTYLVPLDKADKLLRQGYYFLSRFGKTCPVQLYEKINPVQMYLPLKEKNDIYPVVHRHYLYFINGTVNLEKFRNNPLKYIQEENRNVPLYPLKFAIIGPPKCGKTTLAERFAKEFGIQIITKSGAVEYVLTDLSWTVLATDARNQMMKDKVVSRETLMKCVLAQAMTRKCITQGFILDGFPENIQELEELTSGDMIPYLVINLAANLNTVLERNVDCICDDLICSYNGWCCDQNALHLFFHEEYQNIFTIDANRSKWDVWSDVRDKVYEVMHSIHEYCFNVSRDLPVKLEYLCISPYEFSQRLSTYKNLCPVCYSAGGVLNPGGEPPDRKGLVQYLDKYYWVCSQHLDKFLTGPQTYIPSLNFEMTDELPKRVELTEEELSESNLYGSGYDMVILSESQPNAILKEGDRKFAAEYLEFTYLFINEENIQKFMKEPDKYAQNMPNFVPKKPLPKLETSKLPTLGYLQQTQTRQIIKTIYAVGKLRPKCPGLDCSVSASVYMGIILKIENPNASAESKDKYKECEQKFYERCNWLKNKINGFKSHPNPFIRLPKYLKAQMEEVEKEKERKQAQLEFMQFNSPEAKRKRAEELLRDLKIKYTPVVDFPMIESKSEIKTGSEYQNKSKA